MEDRKKAFFNIIESRSNENEKALMVLLDSKCYALVGAVIRMELDSLLRVHYFNNVDNAKQEFLLDGFFSSSKWSATDRKMVEQLSYSLGWARHIYEFCCAFIHLSPYHDWATTPDIPNLTIDKRRFIVNEIKGQQNDAWGYNTTLEINEDFVFDDLIPFAPHIFKKLRSNLLCEMKN